MSGGLFWRQPRLIMGATNFIETSFLGKCQPKLTLREKCPNTVFSGPYFPVFGLNSDIYEVNLRIHSEYKKIRARQTPYLDTFHAV